MREILWLAALAACSRPGDSDTSPPSPDDTDPELPVPRPTGHGAGAWWMDGVESALADAQVGWFYTWSPTPADQAITPPEGVEFVPMIWGEADATAERIATARGPVLLGFNEPDLEGQANLSVERALELWPRLEAAGLPLCSPATAGDPSVEGSWLRRFLAGAQERGLRVDKLCVHFYASAFEPDVAMVQLERFLQRVHQAFPQYPIWVTEYALVRYGARPEFPSPQDQAAFARASVPALRSLPFVERYAWFAVPPWRDQDSVHLYEAGGEPTVVGAAYRDADPADVWIGDRDATGELLSDPGFEEGRPVSSWNDVLLVREGARTGSGAAAIPAGSWGWLERSAARLPAGAYQARAWVRGSATWAQWEARDLDGRTLATAPATVGPAFAAWTLDFRLSGEGSEDGVHVVLSAGTDEGVTIDDVSLRRVGD